MGPAVDDDRRGCDVARSAAAEEHAGMVDKVGPVDTAAHFILFFIF